MQINPQVVDDTNVLGLTFTFSEGETYNVLTVHDPDTDISRAFYFNQDGSFDGTGIGWVPSTNENPIEPFLRLLEDDARG